MSKVKKMGSLFMALIMCLSMSMIANAKGMENDEQRYGEREVITVLKTEYATTTVTPSGQPAGGSQFPTGGGLYVNTSGGPSVSVSLGVSWGVVSTSVSVGTAGKESSVGGMLLPAPDNTNYYVAKIRKTYKVEYKKIDMYQYDTYIRTVYVSDATFYSQSAYMEKL